MHYPAEQGSPHPPHRMAFPSRPVFPLQGRKKLLRIQSLKNDYETIFFFYVNDELLKIKERTLYNIHGVFISSFWWFLFLLQSCSTRLDWGKYPFSFYFFVFVLAFRGWLGC